jgi:hypothetical protein
MRAVEDVISPADLALVGIRSWEAEEVHYLDRASPGIAHKKLSISIGTDMSTYVPS